eukprot:403879_1
MCLGKPYQPPRGRNQSVFELKGFQRCGLFAILQIIGTLIGLIITFSWSAFGSKFVVTAIIGLTLIILFNIIPNGRPCFLNLHRMGRVYIAFDSSDREVLLITTHYGGYRTEEKVISSYSQFRGIAVHHKSHQILFLCRREESLLLKQVGEVLPPHKGSIQEILEEISLLWFSTEGDGFFGVTYVDFSNGIVAENNIKVNVDYDFYLKRSETWKPKNNPMGMAKVKKRIEVDDNGWEKDQRLGPAIGDAKFVTVNGRSVDVGLPDEDDNHVVDYV